MDPIKEYGKSSSMGSYSPGEDSPTFAGDSEPHKTGFVQGVFDSFRRDPRSHVTPKGAVGADGKVFDVETAATATAQSPLARRLKGRHLQMIAIGGSIGALAHA